MNNAYSKLNSTFIHVLNVCIQDAIQAQIVIKKMNEMMDTTNKTDPMQDSTDAVIAVPETEKATDVSIHNIFLL